jgi:hypothetical protein
MKKILDTEAEGRVYLYKYAHKKDIKITEFRSGDGTWFVHLENDSKTATAHNKDKDHALYQAFLNFYNRELTFIL